MDQGRAYLFDQRKYTNAWDYSVANLGIYGAVFVPDTCAKGKKCNLMVILGGCGTKGMFFMGSPIGFMGQDAGQVPQAVGNDMIILSPGRRDACWNVDTNVNIDGALYKDDPQTEAIMAMIKQVTTEQDPNVDLFNMPNDIAKEYFAADKAKDQDAIDKIAKPETSDADMTGHWLSRAPLIWVDLFGKGE